MNPKALSKFVGQIRQQTQGEINDVTIWSQVALQGIKERANDAAFLNAVVFPVHSRKTARTVFRDEAEIRKILSEAGDSKLYWSILVYLVSRVEGAIGGILRGFLRADRRRLLIGAAGKKIEFRMVVETEDYSDLVEHMITMQLHDVSYQRPSEQIEYFEKVTGVNLEAEFTSEWIEVKATRDILVHNEGLANSLYVAKAGTKSRAAIGSPLPVDIRYFEHATITMKTLIGRVASRIQANLKPKKIVLTKKA